MSLPQPDPQQIEQFFVGMFLDDGYRMLLSSAARLEAHRGIGYTMSEVADDLAMDLDTVLRLKRSGRVGAKRWRDDGRGAPPIALERVGFRASDDGQGRVACYRLTPGTAEIVLGLVEHYVLYWRVGEALERMLTRRGRWQWPTLPSSAQVN
jgi:hypothetical protein